MTVIALDIDVRRDIRCVGRSVSGRMSIPPVLLKFQPQHNTGQAATCRTAPPFLGANLYLPQPFLGGTKQV